MALSALILSQRVETSMTTKPEKSSYNIQNVVFL